jgi:hypothetical protein
MTCRIFFCVFPTNPRFPHVFQGNIPLIVLERLSSAHDLLTLDGDARQGVELGLEEVNFAVRVDLNVFEGLLLPLDFDCVLRHLRLLLCRIQQMGIAEKYFSFLPNDLDGDLWRN